MPTTAVTQHGIALSALVFPTKLCDRVDAGPSVSIAVCTCAPEFNAIYQLIFFVYEHLVHSTLIL